jgi:hypothetical protein
MSGKLSKSAATKGFRGFLHNTGDGACRNFHFANTVASPLLTRGTTIVANVNAPHLVLDNNDGFQHIENALQKEDPIRAHIWSLHISHIA